MRPFYWSYCVFQSHKKAEGFLKYYSWRTAHFLESSNGGDWETVSHLREQLETLITQENLGLLDIMWVRAEDRFIIFKNDDSLGYIEVATLLSRKKHSEASQ